MRPLTLTLKGFRGIRDGLGLNALTLDFEKLAGDAQLVALVGANGRGKVRFQGPLLGSEEWACVADTAMAAGERVRVVSVEGSFLKVDKA